LANEQFGFRQNYSTDKSIFKLLNHILNALNNKKTVGGIFCDLRKAFGCVYHATLMSKLEFYGVTGRMYDLIKSYLQDHYQRVVICTDNRQKTYSEWGRVSRGVPQGSILGPFLFLVYINDLPLSLNKNSLPILFADDTSVLVARPNQHEFLIDINQIFAQLNSWFDSNLLSLNFDKTKFVHFKMRNTPVLNTNISYKSNSVISVNNTKFLGLTVETNLSWKTHVDRLLLKLSTVCYVLRTLKSYMSRDVLIMIYYAYFHSTLTYGIIFWGSFPYNIDLFRLQKRAIRIVCGIHSRVSCREYFKQLKILPLQSQYLIQY
jgi:hypothetical protein